MVDFRQAMNYPFRDPSWGKKIFVMGISAFLFPPLITGYCLEIIRNTVDGEEERMPSLSRWKAQTWEGLIISLFMLVCVFVMVTILAMVGAFMLQGNTLDLYSGGQLDMNSLLQILMVLVGVLLVFMLMVMVMSLFAPAMILRYALQGTLSSFLNVPAALSDIRLGIKDYMILSSVQTLGALVCLIISFTFVGVFAAPFITALSFIVTAKMLGDYYTTYFH